MARRYLSIFLILPVLIAFPLVCAAQQAGPSPGVESLAAGTDPGVFLKKVDNFEVVLDGSMSMAEEVGGKSKLSIAKQTITKMIETMPDLKLIGSARLCGNNSCPASQESRLIYGPEYFTKKGLNDAINSVARASGGTPMSMSIGSVKGDIASLSGPSAMIVVSDGVRVKQEAVDAVKKLKAAYGDKLTCYTVWVGDDADGKKVLDEMAVAGGSKGAYSASDLLAGTGGMPPFVETVFLKQVIDSDKDGVSDYLDKCPGTPAGIKVDMYGCPIDGDTDGDGVPDSIDLCKNTPKGAKVDVRGCWTIGAVHFDFNKAQIKPTAYPELNNVVAVMKHNPELRIIIDGHTDIIGTAAYNMNLSRKRALSAMTYLLKKGISKNRLSTKGYGFSRPIATNETEDGRAKNRRVEFEPTSK
ncbi:MAG: OmpA family protein [Deltaproteobacteria bacterium]|nr:OmpA family protein [Deltaproteobacteria bacterium]